MDVALIIILTILISLLTYMANAGLEISNLCATAAAALAFIGSYIIKWVSENDKNAKRLKRKVIMLLVDMIRIIGVIIVIALIFSIVSDIIDRDNASGSTNDEIITIDRDNSGEQGKNESIVVLNNIVSGDFASEGEVDCYEYVPSISGMYRFDFESDDVNTDYKFYLYAENGDTDINSYFSRDGKNIELNAGEKYTIKVVQYSGFPKYAINIGVPNEIYEVCDTYIEGTLAFEGQEDRYTYTAPITGRYRFDFISDDDNSNYEFNLYAQNNEQLVQRYYSDDGKTIDLVEGETYNIVIAQYSGFVSYKITIGEPKIANIIEGNSFSGSLLFKDQKDCYTYIAPKTGRYRFDFKSDNDNNNYRFCLYTKNNKQLADRYYSDDGKTIDLEAGEEYRIEIVQHSGFENYTINIGVPNDISNIEGNVILGNLTYIDQENIYIYKANTSGKYKFTFETNDANENYLFYVISPINENLASTEYRIKNKSVQLEEGQIYTLKVRQSSGFPEYQINIQLDEL